MRKICAAWKDKKIAAFTRALCTNRIMNSALALCAARTIFIAQKHPPYHRAQIWKCSVSETLLLPFGRTSVGIAKSFSSFERGTHTKRWQFLWLRNNAVHKRHLSSVTCGSPLSLCACTCELRLFLSAPILTQSRAATSMETGKSNVSTFMRNDQADSDIRSRKPQISRTHNF
jgi:hypothetical protein